MHARHVRRSMTAPSSPPPQPAPQYNYAPAPVNESNSRTLAAVSYVLTWLTGLIIFFVAPKEDKYARWHAIQAIGLGVALVVVAIVVNILSFIVPFLGFLMMLVWLGVIVLVIIMAVKAYKGEKVRLPVIADMADKNA